MYGALYWLYERRYILAEIHNALKIIPSSFIIYFGKAVPSDPFRYGYGYFMLLKLPAILADLGISLVIFKVVKEITRDRKRAFFGMLFYLFNPITIFLSSVWGQSESLVAFSGLLSFVFLVYRKLWLSIPLMFVSVWASSRRLLRINLLDTPVYRVWRFSSINFISKRNKSVKGRIWRKCCWADSPEVSTAATR